MKRTIVVRVALHGRELKCFAFDQDLIRIGRDPRCDICLPSRSVSRVHVQLKRGETGFLLADSGSSNGTLVNGDRVKAYELESGDRVSIGNFTLTVEITDGPKTPLLKLSAHPQNANLPTIREAKERPE